jgi:tetratricopeptide (TPR) repeat protein
VWYQGDYAQASDHCEQSIRLFRQVGDDLAVADTLQWQAAIVRDQGNYERAAELFEQSLTRFRALNDVWNEGNVFNGMGDLAFNRGNLGDAQACYERARAIWGVEGLLIDFPLRGLGRIAYVQGDAARADSMLQAVVTNIRKWMNTAILRWCLHHLGFVKHLLGDSASASALLREALTIQHRELHCLCIVESLERFAWIAADQHCAGRATRLFGAAEALRKWMGAPLPLGDKPLFDSYLEKARAALESGEFNQAWAEGVAMTMEQAVDFALSDPPCTPASSSTMRGH